MTVLERFWLKVNVAGPDECWEWNAATRHGYGAFNIGGGVIVHAHRLSWFLHRGPIPQGLCICHLCDNPPCVNPDHLWIGTHADNMADKDAKGRGNRPVWRGEQHPNARLSDATVAEIRGRGKTESANALARLYGVSDTHIRRLLAGAQR